MNNQEKQGTAGYLPAMAPLANPYVPFQLEDPPKYELRKALIRGTLYSGLDLPFMGMVNKTEKPETPINQVQTAGFALQELALYLDTHRNDTEALALYRQLQQLYAQARENYVKMDGPLTHSTQTDRDGYAWLDDPWPWEYEKKQEA